MNKMEICFSNKHMMGNLIPAFEGAAFSIGLRSNSVELLQQLDVPLRSSLYDTAKDKRRNVVERFFNRLKEFRRAETRYDKRDGSFLAFVMITASCVAFSILHI